MPCMNIGDFTGRPKVVAMALVAGLIAIIGVAAVADVGLQWLAANESVSVHEVRVDRKHRAYVEIIFTRRVAPQRVGEIVLDPPASVFPAINGVWRWTTGNILRFEPAGGFPIASQYKLALAADRIATPAFPFRGEREFVIKTDDFVVRTVTWREVPSPNGTVVLQ